MNKCKGEEQRGSFRAAASVPSGSQSRRACLLFPQQGSVMRHHEDTVSGLSYVLSPTSPAHTDPHAGELRAERNKHVQHETEFSSRIGLRQCVGNKVH